MAEMPDKVDFLRFSLIGLEEPFIIPVPEGEAERFERVVLNSKPCTKIFHTNGLNGLSAAVNLKFVQMAYVLWEPLIHASWERIEEDEYCVAVHFRDGGKHEFTTEHYTSLALMFDLVEDMPPTFLHCIDQDGERAIFNTNRVALLTAPTAWIEEGNELILKEQTVE